MSIGLIILVATLGVAAVGGVGFAATGTQNQYPPGKRRTAKCAGVTVLLIQTRADLPWLQDSTAVRAADALAALSAKAVTYGHKISALKDVVVYIADDEAFEKTYADRLLKGHALAFATRVPRQIGAGPPMIVLRDKFVGQPQFRSLVIHEGIHILAKADGVDAVSNAAHSDPRYFGPSSTSLETRTR